MSKKYPVATPEDLLEFGDKFKHKIDKHIYAYVKVSDPITGCSGCYFARKKVSVSLCANAPRCHKDSGYGVFKPVYRNGKKVRG